MRARGTTAVLIAALCLPAGGQDADVFARADALARRVERADIAVGFAIGLIVDGETFVRGYGETTRGGGGAPGGDTLYEIGSITKVFTGILLADAVGLGRVTVHDRANDLLPEEFQLAYFDEEPVELWHLATHTSGLPRMPGSWAPQVLGKPYLGYEVDDLHATIDKVKLMRAPGTRYAYSNLAVGLLGHLMEREAGVPYEELLRARVLDPLGLADTRVTLSDAQRERLAPPYDPDMRPGFEWEFGVLAPCGALHSSVNDLLIFARVNIDRPDTTVGLALERAQEPLYDPEGDFAVAYGWHLAGDKLYHSGRTGGYSASLAIDRERRSAVVLVTNSPGDEVSRLAGQLWNVARGEEPGENPLRVAVPLGRDVLERYTGKYRLGAFQVLTITLEDGGLFAALSFRPPMGLYPSSETEFYYRAVDAAITFVLDDDGRPSALVLHMNGQDQEAPRVE